MSQISSSPAHATAAPRLIEQCEESVSRWLANVRGARRLARNRRILQALNDDQLDDAGIDRRVMSPRKASIAIEAGLMTKLMLMR